MTSQSCVFLTQNCPTLDFSPYTKPSFLVPKCEYGPKVSLHQKTFLSLDFVTVIGNNGLIFFYLTSHVFLFLSKGTWFVLKSEFERQELSLLHLMDLAEFQPLVTRDFPCIFPFSFLGQQRCTFSLCSRVLFGVLGYLKSIERCLECVCMERCLHAQQLAGSQ